MSSICISCNEPTRKYKCPKCMVPYCSLGCYKLHKESKCAAQQTGDGNVNKNAGVTRIALEEEPTLHEPFSTEDTVTREKLELLRNSKPLRELLQNTHLRNLLQEIDVAPNAWKAMRVAMQEPLFVEFADACLPIVEPFSGKEDAKTMFR